MSNLKTKKTAGLRAFSWIHGVHPHQRRPETVSIDLHLMSSTCHMETRKPGKLSICVRENKYFSVNALSPGFPKGPILKSSACIASETSSSTVFNRFGQVPAQRLEPGAGKHSKCSLKIVYAADIENATCLLCCRRLSILRRAPKPGGQRRCISYLYSNASLIIFYRYQGDP